MGAKTVQVDLVPKFTSLVGDQVFPFDAHDVRAFESGYFAYWRAELIGASTTFNLKLEGSIDGETWSQILTGDPGADNETVFGLDSVDWPLIRAVVTLAGVGAGATLWVLANFTLRKDARG